MWSSLPSLLLLIERRSARYMKCKNIRWFFSFLEGFRFCWDRLDFRWDRGRTFEASCRRTMLGAELTSLDYETLLPWDYWVLLKIWPFGFCSMFECKIGLCEIRVWCVFAGNGRLRLDRLSDSSEVIQLLVSEIRAEIDSFGGFVSSMANPLVCWWWWGSVLLLLLQNFVWLLREAGYSLTFFLVVVLRLISMLAEFEMRTYQNPQVIFWKSPFGLSGLP